MTNKVLASGLGCWIVLSFCACSDGGGGDNPAGGGKAGSPATPSAGSGGAPGGGSSSGPGNSGAGNGGSAGTANHAGNGPESGGVGGTAIAGTGGTGAGAGGAGLGGGGSGGSGGGSGCVMTGTWPVVAPDVAGPYEVVTETNVGPMAGVANPDGQIPRFNVYRPATLGEGGVCHPIVTWGNGHGDRPQTYEVLIKQLVSHGFVVVASLSSNTSQGDPPPMLAGVTWMIEENAKPESKFYHHLDTTRIGATGHSEGGASTARAGSDPRISSVAPICGASANQTLHGPALFICGGMDTVAKCSGVETAFNSVTNQPIMFANNLASDHGSWLFQGGIKGPTIVAVTAWMRLNLMGDMSQRSRFYGPSCTMCQDTEHWTVKQKMMDQ